MGIEKISEMVDGAKMMFDMGTLRLYEEPAKED